MQSSVAVPGGRSVVIRWALHEESYWQKSLKDSYLRSRKEGESLSVRLQRWDGMRQQLDRSLCQLRGHERESERERDPRTEEFSSKFVMEGKVEVVEEERDQDQSSGQSQFPVPLPAGECWRFMASMA